MDKHCSNVRAPGARGALLALMLMTAFICLGSVSPSTKAVAQTGEIWLLVDTTALTLTVMRGATPVKVYPNIAIGSNGTTREKVIRDERTPLGEFTINAIRPSTRFHRFLAIDYPNRLDIGSALIDGRISLKEYDALQGALDKGEQPSQETAIGGYLGIHGLGTGDLEVHGAFNWTNGCIAMTNEEIDELAESISIGTRISIR